jgi:transposase
MLQAKSKKYTYFIGTDVSRNKLDLAVMEGKLLLFHREIKNEPEVINAFLQEIKSLKGFTTTRAVFAMEQTGIYCNHLLSCLQKLKANIVVEGTLQIRNSMGHIRGKNDKLDSIKIAEYAYKCREDLRLWVPKRKVVQQLASLSSLRYRLLTWHVAISTPLKEQATFVKKGTANESNRLCSRSIEAICKDIADVEAAIAVLIASDERLKHLTGLLTSVPCVGPVTAVQILVCTNEFRDIRCPKKFACYAGVAPFAKESGTIKGKSRVSPIANKRMKALLHNCAVIAVRSVPEIKAYYERKTKTEGKHKMLVLNAVRNKLVLRIFSCVNQDRLYAKDYQRPSTIPVELTVEQL